MLLEKSVTPPSPCSVSLSLLNASSLSSPYSTSDADDVLLRYNFRSRREIFNYTLSIPTTINEESSRYSRTPSPHAERFTFRSLSEEFDLPIPERSPLIAQASSCEWPNGNNSDAATDNDNEARGRHNSEDSGHVTMTEDSGAAARADNYGSDIDVTDCPAETDKLLSDVSLLTSETQDGSCKLSHEMRIDDLEIHQLSESEDNDAEGEIPSETLVRTEHILTKFGSAGRAEASA